MSISVYFLIHLISEWKKKMKYIGELEDEYQFKQKCYKI